MHDFLFPILAVAVLLVSVSFLVPLAERLRIPHTVLLAALGVTVGAAGLWLDSGKGWGVLGDLLHGFGQLGIPAQAFLAIFLPPLLFIAGLTIDVRRLIDEVGAVLLMAVVAVVVCTVVVGVTLAGAADALGVGFGDKTLVACLLLGSIIATTDPAAVVGIFRDIGAPRRLTILVEGESLFNDAAAIALFGILLGTITGQSAGGVGAGVVTFLVGFSGGLAIGFVLARAACDMLPRLHGSLAAETTVTIALAYLAYIIGEHYFHVSGVVAVASAALTVAAYGPLRLAPSSWRSLVETWEKVDFWATSLIFVLAAMLSARVIRDLTLSDFILVCILVVAALVARGLVLYGLLPGLTAIRLVQPVSARYKVVILWGGLRGAVTMVLALAVAENHQVPEAIRNFVSVVAIGFVLSTLFVNAPSLRHLLRLLGLDRLDPVELALRNRVMGLSRNALKEEVNTLAKDYGLDPSLAGRLVEGQECILPAADVAETALPEEVRLEVGLLTLANREKEFYLAQFDARTISRHLTSQLVAAADRVADQVKTDGIEGYHRASRQATAISPRLQVALWFHRRLQWSGPLAEALADRFESLLIQRLVLREVRSFNRRAVRPMLGESTCATLDAILAERREAVQQALEALELQYPRYAEALGAQYLGRAALRIEEADYRAKQREALISREVFNDLLRDLGARREAVERRPPLDLGLKLAEMVRRVPMFATLDGSRLATVARMLRPMLATPSERIVAKGERGDAMYFIAAGAVEVVLDKGRIRLEAGEFFGEMALVLKQARNADVVAAGFCHLLVLQAGDFNRLLRGNPELRAEIELIVHRRLASNVAHAAD